MSFCTFTLLLLLLSHFTVNAQNAASSQIKVFNCTALEKSWREFPGLCRIFEANFLLNDTVQFDPHGIEVSHEYVATFMRSKCEKIPHELFTKIPKLVAFEAQFCQMKEITKELFKNSSHLKKFDVSENEITIVERDTFDGAIGLEILKLSRNQIHAIHREAFYWLPELKRVMLNENRLYAIDKHLLSRQAKLEFVDLSHNFLANKFDFVVYFVPKLDVSHNSLASATIDMTVHDIGELTSGCSSEIIFNHNNMKDFEIIGQAIIRSLDVSYNKFKSMERIILEKAARLKVLNLDSNPFSLISRQDLNTYPSLEVLNLRNTSLNYGTNNIFRDSKHLKSLDLSHNQLAEVDMQFFEHLSALEELVLDDNQLSGLNTQMMKTKRSETLEISLFDNQFKCDDLKKIVRKLIRINAKIKERPEWDLRRFESSFQGVECSQ